MSEQLAIQELYDASTVLIAALTFTHCTEDLVRPELNHAIVRLIHARNGIRAAGIAIHVEAALIPDPPSPATTRSDE